jgi:hypothetical protein
MQQVGLFYSGIVDRLAELPLGRISLRLFGLYLGRLPTRDAWLFGGYTDSKLKLKFNETDTEWT